MVLSGSSIDWRFRGRTRSLNAWRCLKKLARRSSADISSVHRLGSSGGPTGRNWVLRTVIRPCGMDEYCGDVSAACWWSRLFGCVGRWVIRLMMTLWATQRIYVDDLHLGAAGPQKYLVIWMMIAAYEAVGTPFAYQKFRGGLRIDFIDYHLSYECWAADLSKKNDASG